MPGVLLYYRPIPLRGLAGALNSSTTLHSQHAILVTGWRGGCVCVCKEDMLPCPDGNRDGPAKGAEESVAGLWAPGNGWGKKRPVSVHHHHYHHHNDGVQ